jgi:diacylglycerol kinase (ATP)
MKEAIDENRQPRRMENKGKHGIPRLISATGYSLKGLKSAWHREAAFRQEVGLLVVLTPAALWLGQTYTQKALLIFSVLVVLIVEILNSAVESIVDRIGPERHPLSGQAKDLGSAAVFISLVVVVLVWGCIILDRWY